MNSDIFKKIENIFQKQNELSRIDFEETGHRDSRESSLQDLIANETTNDQPEVRKRIHEELNGLGPIAELLSDDEVSEILINSYQNIFFEKNGQLHQYKDHFFSENSYLAFLDRLSQKCQTYMNREKPFIECQLGHLRLTTVFSEIAQGSHLLSIRKQPLNRWTLDQFFQKNWCNEMQFKTIHEIINSKKNFLVVGGTGSGKTSFLQAILQSLPQLERTVMIEDTQELHPATPVSISLLTRQDPSRNVGDITMDDLLKRALRLRPDRLVVGEIRGPEAKSLLMALATGHEGSFGSLHARTASEALLRLEMLIQMGAPQWTLLSIRRLMAMTVQNIFVLEKKEGVRKLAGIYQISSLEENGLTLHRIDQE